VRHCAAFAEAGRSWLSVALGQEALADLFGQNGPQVVDVPIAGLRAARGKSRIACAADMDGLRECREWARGPLMDSVA
jgi:hypothetical protein